MLSSILFGLLSVLGMMASAVLLWLGYELAIAEWTRGPEIIAVVWSFFMAGLAAWGAYTAMANAWFEFSVRNY